MDNITMIFASFKIYGKLNLFWFLRDSKYSLIQSFASMLSLLANYFVILFLARLFKGLGGLNSREVMLFLSLSTLVKSLYTLFFADYNNGAVSRVISRGQLDHYLIQPQPIWVQILTRGFIPASTAPQLIFAFSLLLLALNNMGQLSLVNVVSFLFIASCSLAVIVAVTYICSCLSFYYPRAAEEISIPVIELFYGTIDYPLGHMPVLFQIFCSTIVPVGLVAWLPVYLFIHNGLAGLCCVFILAICIVTIATIFFQRGLNTYAIRGSSRYSSLGHR